MDLSIIIVNWNTREYLKRCLYSLSVNPANAKTEIIVVDNASSDESAQMVRKRFPGLTLIENAENVGYALANNQGVAESSGEHILLLNPDTEMRRSTLDGLLAFSRKHPDAAAVGCRIVGIDGKVQESCRSFPEPAGVLFEYLRLSRLFPKSRLFGSYRMTYFDYKSDMEVDQPMASCLLIPRRAWDDVGSFDEDFPIFFNEVDWCYRAKQRGWKVYFTARTEVKHHGGASTRQVKSRMIRESHRSLSRFYAKHYKGRIPKPVYWFILAAVRVNSFFSSRLRFGARQKQF